MLSLLCSLLGFGTSFLPRVLDFFQDKQDKKHELALMERQLSQQIELGELALKSRHIDADIAEYDSIMKHSASLQRKSSQWVVNLAATVRPVITYLLFLEFFVLTWLYALGWLDGGMYVLIWSEEIQAIWAAVVSFWFGSRTFARASKT